VKVLFIAPSLQIMGGQAVQCQRLLSNLAECASLELGFLPVNPRLPGMLEKLQKIKYVRTVVTSIYYLLQLLIFIPRYDILHIFSASYWSFLLAPTPAILIGRLFGKKLLLNYRSGEAPDHLANWRTALPIIRLTDKVVVPSGYLEAVFGSFGVEATVVPNTLDLSHYKFRSRQPLRPMLLSNRNFEPLYNVECVLRAFAIIQNQYPEARLIVAGDGSQREKLHQVTRELELKNVEFPGRIEQKDMPTLYDRADIYVNATNIDNMPVSLIEAFSCGLPVVTTNAGGIPYIASDNQTALMVEKNDHQAIARSVIHLLEDPALSQRLCKAARENCVRYTWSSVRDLWIKLYHSMVEAPSLFDDQRNRERETNGGYAAN
jgi:glycosyltransferase involved in cell wall biosynthesis